MEHESDWVADVRRWCLAGAQAKAVAPAPSNASDSDNETYSGALGYEAAHPALQSRHWPDAPHGEQGETSTPG